MLVTPELGSELYDGKDKTNDYNFFYWQPTAKPTLIGMTSAWVSGIWNGTFRMVIDRPVLALLATNWWRIQMAVRPYGSPIVHDPE